jgi:WD40 repeat protein
MHTALEAMTNDSGSRIEKVAVNADCSMIATKDSTRPRTVWIWPIASPIPQTVLNFREHVKQILWHPTLPNVLLVLTSQKDPTVYIWYDQGAAPAIGIIPLSPSSKGSGRFEGCWLPNEISRRHVFMLASPEAFDVGFLDARRDGIFFESLLERDFLTDEPTESCD